MSGSTSRTDETTERNWTVFGHYRDEELPDGGILDGDYAGVFYADTAEEAEVLAYEDQPWLEADSVSVVPGVVQGVRSVTPESQQTEPAP